MVKTVRKKVSGLIGTDCQKGASCGTIQQTGTDGGGNPVYGCVVTRPCGSSSSADGGRRKRNDGEYASIMSSLDASGWPQGYLNADATSPDTLNQAVSDTTATLSTVMTAQSAIQAQVDAINQIMAGTDFENQPSSSGGCAGLPAGNKQGQYGYCVHQAVPNLAAQAALLGLSTSDADALRQAASAMLPSLMAQLTTANANVSQATNAVTAAVNAASAASDAATNAAANAPTVDPNAIPAPVIIPTVPAPVTSYTWVWVVGGVILLLAVGGYFRHKHKKSVAAAANLTDLIPM